MIPIARRYDSEDAKRRILSACVRLFIEKGYREAKMAEIIACADVSPSKFHNIFHSKDGVLEELTEFMFDNQFSLARRIMGEEASPVLVYAFETAIQMTLTELNENLREIYVEAYTQPKQVELINQKTATELYHMFGSYLPGYSESDFYELEIGTSGIMRGYMARPCDKYFTLNKKLERFITMTLQAYRIPETEIAEALDYVAKADIVATANAALQELFQTLAMRFNFVLTEPNEKK